MRFLLHSRQFSTDKQQAHLRLEESNTSPVHVVCWRSTDVYCACLYDATVCVQGYTLPKHTASVEFQIFVPTQNPTSHKTSQSIAVTPNQLKFRSPISRIKAYSFLHLCAPTRISANSSSAETERVKTYSPNPAFRSPSTNSSLLAQTSQNQQSSPHNRF